MSDNASSEPSSALSNGDQSTKKEALRKAGAEYFDKVLARASAGKDPFIEAPKTRKKTQDEALDPDLETVGRVLEGARLYFVGSVYCISASLSLILLKVSLADKKVSYKLLLMSDEVIFSLELGTCRCPCKHYRHQAHRPFCTCFPQSALYGHF